ncbi:uncharacterized protein SETTUDRAFT_140469 [Exserohilum turcica Et28A]|uniref:N-acetyltransferase domain-containing protein n=1 Tax=Exserohilum turcicum (strain 28A) TaxID=671987 RepID=R0JMD1_EXST2|nr:uncharacterized protein SETTUDRAFT_140469 [Exserohilum turcica Et28A]EOA82403.1 hypothetical protein SETTUDRAFT_140469 [Exserohilum turcica Et28A]
MADFNFHITTPRLYISYCNPANDDHCDSTIELLHGAPSMRFNPDAKKEIPDREAARKMLENMSKMMQEKGYGRYMVSLRSDEHAEIPFSERKLETIGVVSMQLGRVEGVQGPTIPDVGFSIIERYHGKGYASEAVEGLMKYYSEKGVRAFAGFTSDENESAKKLFRRLGYKNHGVRTVRGIRWSDVDIEVDIWTWGLEEGQKLEDFGL